MKAAHLRSWWFWGFPPILAAAMWLCHPIIESVRFVEEHVSLNVAPDAIQVSGDYLLENTSGLPRLFVVKYPVPMDESHPCPERLDANAGGHPTRMLRLQDDYYGLIPFSPHERLHFVVEYCQNVTASNASYILTSTRSWDRPLRWARFRLCAKGVIIKSSTYPLQPLGEGVWGFEFSDFMPRQDWCLTWDAL